MVGHLLRAAGAISGLATVLTLDRGVISPTINLDTPDPECDLDYVPNVARERRVRTVFLRHYFMPAGLAGWKSETSVPLLVVLSFSRIELPLLVLVYLSST